MNPVRSSLTKESFTFHRGFPFMKEASIGVKQLISGFFTMIFIAGCSSIPFQETAHVSLESADPRAIMERFREGGPESFRLLTTVVFQYNWNKLSGIGYVDINTKEKTFTIVCINPMGVKLFELSGDKDSIISHFVLEELSKQGNFASAVGEDIKRIYFDLIPSIDAKIERGKYKFIFREPYRQGTMEYVFAGADGNMVEKNYYEDNILIWRVSYYEYQQKDGKIYPGGIILRNYKYGYSLTVRLKEIQA